MILFGAEYVSSQHAEILLMSVIGPYASRMGHATVTPLRVPLSVPATLECGVFACWSREGLFGLVAWLQLDSELMWLVDDSAIPAPAI
ncbi:MAG: hypothetical protein AVDCRST_MAG93-1329 [uncultured Chloroflexia bacterium]|uniref:Uncharacterized protein n=1 Tax=uncultured Chloroflexia bacterium TaxID=1672391 RepID=A0A6J4I4F0_9CHLR|nr:MAG: hypothetical protein AVDCRST_MAG93-1329 [uncultured Chloroflexia bacterium]